MIQMFMSPLGRILVCTVTQLLLPQLTAGQGGKEILSQLHIFFQSDVGMAAAEFASGANCAPDPLHLRQFAMDIVEAAEQFADGRACSVQ